MHKVVEVKPLEGYRLRVKFSDGTEGEANLSDIAGKGVFEKLTDADYFCSVFVDSETHTVAWPGGLDLCPDSLYAEITGKVLSSLLHSEVHSVKA